MKTCKKLDIDVFCNKQILDHASKNVRIVFNIFGGVPFVGNSIQKSGIEGIIEFFMLHDAILKQMLLIDKSLYVLLYKYLIKIKDLIA